MKKAISALALASVFTCLSFSVFAQTSGIGGTLNIPTTASFEKLKVTQESVFQGKVFFDNGLSLNGDARFLNNIVGDGDLQIAKNVRFVGLPENPTINYIITGDVSGDLSRAPLTVLARELESTLKSLNELTVNNATVLRGQLTFGDGLQISGAANFADEVLIAKDLSVNGGVKLNLPEAAEEFSPGNTVLTFDPNSSKIIPVSGTVLGTPLAPGVACPVKQLPANWERRINQLTTDRCSPAVKVGIGTQSPVEMLHVTGNGYFQGWLKAGRNRAGGAMNQLRGSLEIGINEEFVNIGHDGNHSVIESSAPANNQANNPALHINYSTANPVIIGNSGQASTTTKNYLFVGGNTFLGRNLVVGAPSSIHNQRLVVEGGNALIAGENWNNGSGAEAYLALGDTNNTITATFGKGVSISTYTAPNGIFLAQSGKVGIGTGLNEPTAKLHVKASANEAALLVEVDNHKKFKVASNGKVFAEEINVAFENAFPDYVFKSDYKLMTISQLNQYIKTNGHLPGMPTAEEVKENGGDLGELTRKLTEKVEELSLYIIELEQKTKELEAGLKKLQK